MISSISNTQTALASTTLIRYNNPLQGVIILKEQKLSALYNSMWKRSIDGFTNNQFEFDPFLNHRELDFRRGLTVLGRLKGNTLTEVVEFLNEGQSIEPNQHFYTKEDIHLTILSIISCTDTFDIGKINKEDYINVIDKAMNSLKSFEISFKGITASPSCVMIQGFPMDENLLMLRNQLRHSFRSSILKHSMDERYKLKTAHSTVIRFKNPLLNNKTFIDYLNRYRDYNFGCVNFDRIDLVYNDWYMTNSVVKSLKTFEFER